METKHERQETDTGHERVDLRVRRLILEEKEKGDIYETKEVNFHYSYKTINE